MPENMQKPSTLPVLDHFHYVPNDHTINLQHTEHILQNVQ